MRRSVTGTVAGQRPRSAEVSGLASRARSELCALCFALTLYPCPVVLLLVALVQYHLNGGKPVATSIAATEHSVMTSWPDERQAIENMISEFGGENKVFAIVFDSYDYDNALNKVLPAVADAHKARGGTMVIRPDSGDPVECIISALRAGEKNFPTKKNMKVGCATQGRHALRRR